MRILVITKTLDAHRHGGFETHVTELCTRLAKKHTVHVVCRKIPARNAIRKKYNFKVYDVSYAGIGIDAVDNLTSIPAFSKKIKELIQTNGYDIVHGHGISSQAYLKTKGRSPFIYTLHGISSEHLIGYKQPLRALLKVLFDKESTCVKAADKIICVSNKTAEDAVNYYNIRKEKCVVIPNGVDTKRFKKKRHRKTNTIGFVGYVHEHKGIHFLLRAMKLVIKYVNDAELIIVGNGNIKKFRNMARKLEIENSVNFTGPVSRSKLEKLYSTFDVFVMPSLYEGFGIAPLEAMASGVPIIVSDTGQLSELADRTGFVIDPENTRQLAEKIETILQDDKLRTMLSKNCLEKAKYYEWDRIAKMTLDVYKSLL